MDKVTRRCPQTTTFWKRKESAYQPNALPLGQTGSRALAVPFFSSRWFEASFSKLSYTVPLPFLRWSTAYVHIAPCPHSRFFFPASAGHVHIACCTAASPLVKNGPRWGPVLEWATATTLHCDRWYTWRISETLDTSSASLVRAGNRSDSRPNRPVHSPSLRVQELCESRGGRRPGLPVLMSLTVSVDVKQHWTVLQRCGSQFVPNICQPTSEDVKLYIIIINPAPSPFPLFSRGVSSCGWQKGFH